MGRSTDAILAYGYDLGGSDGWKVHDAGEYGELPALNWYTPDEDADEFQEAAERQLLTQIAGFTETDWQAEGYFARQREAKALTGVEFETYGSGDYPMLLLAAHVTTVRFGDCEEIDPVDLQQRPERKDWDAKLTAALGALGIRPTQERARWLLCSYWG